MFKTFEEFLVNPDIKKAKQKLFDMKKRCYNPNNKAYCFYGAKGITICDEWLKDINKFLYWLWENEYQPNSDKEVVIRKDHSKGFSPENCLLVSVNYSKTYLKKTKTKSTEKTKNIIEELDRRNDVKKYTKI